MASIEELGKRVKAKYPGVYDDMADADLGVKVRGKFHGSYDDFVNESPLPSPVAPSITPRGPAPAAPMMQSSVDPFAPKQNFIPQPAPMRPPTPVAPNPMQAPPSALQAQAPGPIAPTVELSPTGQAPPPMPGRIPGMERLGGTPPPVPMPRNPMQAPPMRRPMGDGLENLIPNSEEYVIADDPLVAATVRGASSATIGMGGGILKSIAEAKSQNPIAQFAQAQRGTDASGNPVQTAIGRAGDALTGADEQVQSTFARDASIKNFMDDPTGAITDPRWWLDTVGSAAGSMAPMIASGAGTGAVIGRAAASNLIPQEVAQIAVKYGPSVAASLTESAQVYGSTYTEARKAGLDPETATQAAALVAAGTGLTSIPAHKVGIFNDGIRSIGKRIAVSSAAEGGQEGVQTWWENAVAKTFYDPDRPLMQGIPEAMVGAAIIGAPAGAAGMSEQSRNPEAKARAERARKRGYVSTAPIGPSIEPMIREDLARNPIRPVDVQQKATLAAPPPKSAADSASFFAQQPNVVDRKFKENLPLRRQEAEAERLELEKSQAQSQAKMGSARLASTQEKEQRQRQLIEDRRNARAAKEVEIPETGPSERVQRVMDARDRLSRVYFGKPFAELSNPDRIDVDELVASGEGFAVTEDEISQPDNHAISVDEAPEQSEDDRWLESELRKEEEAKARDEQRKADLEWSELDARTKPLPRAELTNEGAVREVKPLTWREDQDRRRSQRFQPEEEADIDSDDGADGAPTIGISSEPEDPGPPPSILDQVVSETEDRENNPVNVFVRETPSGKFSVNSVNKSDGRRVGHTYTFKTIAEADKKKSDLEKQFSRVQPTPEPREEVIQQPADLSPAPGEDVKQEANDQIPPQAPPAPGPVEVAPPAPVQKAADPQDPGPVESETWQDGDKLRIRTKSLAIDPIRFQYKVDNIGQGGVTDELKDVGGWDDNAAGTIFVWKDPANGKTFVVNGHHRYDLAKRLGVPDVGIKYIDAPDAQSARAAGALQNIREGKGSAIDAAKFLRDTGKTIEDLKAEKISVKGATARDGAALANLAPSIFDDVVHGNINPQRAAIVGEGLSSYDDQKAILKLADSKKATNSEVKEMIRLALAEKAEIAEQKKLAEEQSGAAPAEEEVDLFGNKIGAEPKTTIYEKSQVSNYVRTRLSQEKKLFGLVGSKSAADRLGSVGNEIKAEANKEISDQANQALAVYDKLSERSGPISDLLREGAQRIASGEKADAVKESIYASIRDSVSNLIGPKPAAAQSEVREADSGAVEGSDGSVQGDSRKRTVARGNTVEQTKDGPQQTIVDDIEARESQIAAKNDRNRPIAGVPFSLQQEDGRQPEPVDDRQSSMFDNEDDDGDGSGVAKYAPGTASFTPGTPRAGGSPKGGKPTGKAMASRSEIVKALSHILNDIPIRTGGIRGKGVLGKFDIRQSVIRTKLANDLPTIAHEIGHAIHKYLWSVNKSGKAFNNEPLRPWRKELKRLDYDPNQARVFEGFAEYIRLLLTEPGKAQKAAPSFHSYFHQQLSRPDNADLANVLRESAERINTWNIQPAPVKLAASIDVTPDEKTVIRRIGEWFKDYQYEMVDRLSDLKKTVDLFKRSGADVTDMENAYVMGRMIGGSMTRATHALTEGTVDGNNKVNGEGLQGILTKVATRDPAKVNPRFKRLASDWGIKMANDGMDDFRVYIVAKRLQNYHQQGLDAGFTPDELKEAIRATKTPEIEEAAEALNDYQDRVLDYLVEKGAMQPEVKDWIRSKNEFYVPLYRVMDDQVGAALTGSKMIDLNSPVMRRKGSQREIIDPLESVVRNTYALYSFADRNNVAQALVKHAARVQSQGKLVESDIIRPMKRTEFNLSEVTPQIKEMLEEAGIELPEDFKIDAIASLYRSNTDPQRSKGIVKVIVDGKPELFQMDPTIIRALDSMDRSSANFIVDLLGGFKNILTFGATAGNPEFVITNFIRDQFTAGIQSRNGYIPFYHGLYGAFKLFADKKLVEEWALSGGMSTALIPLTRDNLRLSVDRMTMSKGDLVVRHPGEVLNILRDVLTIAGTKSEQATRIAEFSLAKKKGKSSTTAAFDSRDVTLDFERIGKTAQIINRGVPFFAVAFNAIDRFSEMHNPKNKELFRRTLAIGAGISMLSLGLWWLNKDDEEYKSIEAWKRDLFWLIPTRILGENARAVFGPFIRIPKPPLWGQLWGSTVERMADSLYSKNPLAFEDFGHNFFEQIAPPVMVQAIKPAWEVYSNYNSFTDRPIESQAQQELPAELRYSPSTSEAAKAMSRGFVAAGIKLSPLMIEHLMLGYTAGLGRFAITATEELTGLRNDRPAMGPADRPLLRALSTPEQPYNSTYYKRFNDRYKQLKQKGAGFKKTQDTKYRLTSQEQAAFDKLSGLRSEFTKLATQQHAIEKAIKAKKMSRQDGRKAIDALTARREKRLIENKELFNRRF